MGAIKSGISPFEGLDHASPEPSLGQGQPTPKDFRLARGPPPSGEYISSSLEALLKGKCALGPFLSILVIECKHKCLNVKICP
jgi:hypothetical protein